ncbi:MAG: bifunctional metallophosphatase/5'-nucleotidase [Oligoflexia bacterium]|nr:bifunctional metallophosphatase/5'-nucleotidase [Oligoflexia bacterium]
MKKTFNITFKVPHLTLSLFLFLFLILFSSTQLSSCETCSDSTVVGTITDSSATPLPVADLQVAPCHQLDQSVLTDAKGDFKLKFQTNKNGKNLLCITGSKGTGKILIKTTETEPASSLSSSSSPSNPSSPSHPSKEIVIKANYPVKTTIKMLYFNDVHGAIDNFPKVAAQINKIRKENENTFVFNSGDNFSGNPIVDQYEDKGKPIFDLLNAISLTTMALGNHDFDFGQEILLKRVTESKFPIISANVKVVNSELAKISFPSHQIISTSNDLKIAITSAIEISNNGAPSTLLKNTAGLKFTNPLEELKALDTLKETSGANLLLGLTHMGSEDDYKLAAETKNYDIIIGGHSHTLIKKEVIINNTLIAQAGDYLKNLGVITVVFENESIVSKKNELIEVKKLTEEDPTIKAMVNTFNNNPTLNQIIGIAEDVISGKDELGALITDSMLSVHGADIAFENNGGIRMSKLNRGNIILKNAYELLPFGNEIVLLKMTTKEIRALISYSFNKRKNIDLQVAGIKYIVKTKNSEIDSISLLSYNNEPINEDKIYTVAVNDYIASSYMFEHSDPGVSTTSADNDTLIKFIKSQAKLNYKGIKRALTEKVQ